MVVRSTLAWRKFNPDSICKCIWLCRVRIVSEGNEASIEGTQERQNWREQHCSIIVYLTYEYSYSEQTAGFGAESASRGDLGTLKRKCVFQLDTKVRPI